MNTELVRTTGLSEVTLSIVPAAMLERDAILADAKEIVSITDVFEASNANDTFKKVQKLKKDVEAARKDVKKPVDEIAARIQEIARDFTAPIDLEYERLRILLGEYQRQENDRRRKAEEEARRQAEEIHRKEIEKARIETARLEEENRKLIAESYAKMEVAKKEAEANGLDGEAAADAVAAQIDAKQEELLTQRDEVNETAGRAVEATSAALTANLGPRCGAKSRKNIEFEVIDFKALYASHPECVKMEANTTLIKELLKQGIELPGVKHWITNKAF
jgi:hypothetical protein